MLILSRKLNESIVIDGRIVVQILRLDGKAVKVGIQAPPDVTVHRQEVYEEIQKNNQEALTSGRPALPKLARMLFSKAPAATSTVQQSQAGGGYETGGGAPQLTYSQANLEKNT